VPKADLTPCLERIEWASQALNAVNDETSVWIWEHDPYATATEYYAEADVHVFRLATEFPPIRFGIAASNIIHQLRSALDNLVWQLVIFNGCKPTPGPRGNSFPILLPHHTHKRFGQQTANALAGVHPDHRALIEGLQPYQHPTGQPFDDHPLKWLRELSNRDKHQELELGVAVRSPHHVPQITIEGDDVSVVDSWFAASPTLEPGAIVGWAKVAPPGPDLNVEMKAGGLFLVALRGTEYSLGVLLRVVAAVVEAAVKAFLPALIGLLPIPLTLDPGEVERLYKAARHRDPLVAQSQSRAALWSAFFPGPQV
jgi:hypothetical protein